MGLLRQEFFCVSGGGLTEPVAIRYDKIQAQQNYVLVGQTGQTFTDSSPPLENSIGPGHGFDSVRWRPK